MQSTIAVKDATVGELVLLAGGSVLLGIVAGIAVSWLFKWTWRGLGMNKLPNVAIMWITIAIGAAAGYFVHYLIGDFISMWIGYDLNTGRAWVFVVFFSAIGTPFFYMLIMGWLWDSGRRRGHKLLRVPHDDGIDYTDPNYSDDTQTRVITEPRDWPAGGMHYVRDGCRFDYCPEPAECMAADKCSYPEKDR